MIGWYGTFAILGAYALVSFGVVAGDGAVFQILNLSGGLSMVVLMVSKKVWQSAALNAVWAVIGIVALARLFTR